VKDVTEVNERAREVGVETERGKNAEEVSEC
jgi:hypothetical protein